VGIGENALVSRRRCRVGTLEPLLGQPSGPARAFSFSCCIGVALQLVKILDTISGRAEARPAEPPETIHCVLKGFRSTRAVSTLTAPVAQKMLAPKFSRDRLVVSESGKAQDNEQRSLAAEWYSRARVGSAKEIVNLP